MSCRIGGGRCAALCLCLLFASWISSIILSLCHLEQSNMKASSSSPLSLFTTSHSRDTFLYEPTFHSTHQYESSFDELSASSQTNILIATNSFNNVVISSKHLRKSSTKTNLFELNIGQISSSNLHSFTYGSPLNNGGGLRSPLVMIKTKLEEKLHKQFLKEHMFSCNQTELDEISTLDRRVKLPVYIYEGYFHSMIQNTEIFSKNPNPLIGTDFMKPPASDFLRSFYTTFRFINNNIFLSLQLALYESAIQRNPSQPENDICFIFSDWIKSGKIFGDLSIQIHYGDGNDKNFPKGWHVDAENSLLHFAITLRGSRVLHSRRCATDRGDATEILDKQGPRDVYLTSSALMLHAPKFSYASYDDRVIAIHARILYTSAELQEFRKRRTDNAWKSLTTILADHLARADLKIPNLEQIEKTLDDNRLLHIN